MENIVRKGEIACNKQFLLLSQCFLTNMAFNFYLKCTVKCHLQFVPILINLKFCNLVMAQSISRLKPPVFFNSFPHSPNF